MRGQDELNKYTVQSYGLGCKIFVYFVYEFAFIDKMQKTKRTGPGKPLSLLLMKDFFIFLIRLSKYLKYPLLQHLVNLWIKL